MAIMKEKYIYSIESNMNKSLEKQLLWVRNVFSDKTKYLYDNDLHLCKVGEIYKYKIIPAKGRSHKIGYCVVLQESNIYESDFLACPLSLDDHNGNLGINIGLIYGINMDTECLAEIHKIAYINKYQLAVDVERIKEAKAIGYISEGKYLQILNCYKNFIQTLIEKNTKIVKKNYDDKYKQVC